MGPFRSTLLVVLLVGCTAGSSDGFSLKGDLQWALSFDADAKGRGMEDCDYARAYDGSEDRSLPWLCPDCDDIARVDARLKRGASCRAQISDEDVTPTEWLGWGRGEFFRATTEHFALSPHGTAVWNDDVLSVDYETDWLLLDEGGHVKLTVTGVLERGTARSDPMWGFGVPEAHSCGWELQPADPYRGRYRLRQGKTLPDGWFGDACGEGVRLHGLVGPSLIVSVSAVDCPPCREMAEGESSALADMRADGLDVEAVTLLAPSLSGVVDPISTQRLQTWVDDFGLDAPVLGDRGWGYWLGSESLGDAMGYPLIIVTDPQGKVVQIRSGFGSWEELAAVVASSQ